MAPQASRLRSRFGVSIDIATCATAFTYDDPHSFPFLSMYGLICVDELSQLPAHHTQRINQLSQQADRSVCIVVTNDKWQLVGFGDARPWQTPQWQHQTFKLDLHKPWRCMAPSLQAVLDELRTSTTDTALLQMLQSKPAWLPPDRPTPQSILRLFSEQPIVIVLTCTRRVAQLVNGCALATLFPRYLPRAALPGDIESCAAHYVKERKRKPLH